MSELRTILTLIGVLPIVRPNFEKKTKQLIMENMKN